MKGVCFVRGEQSLSPPSVLVMNCNSFNSLWDVTLIFTLRELTSSMCWSVWPDTVWRRCLTPSSPNILPVDTKRYSKSFFPLLLLQTVESFRRVVLILKKLLLSSGADTGDMEQAGHWKLSSPLDHHLGHSGWFAASGSSYLCAIQGQ